MTKETHELVYETSLKNMNDDKLESLNHILFRRNWDFICLFTAITFAPFIIIGGATLPWLSISVAAILPFLWYIGKPTLKSIGFTKNEYKEFVKSGGLKRIRKLTKEYIKTKQAILSGKFQESDAEKSLVKLNVLENELKSSKQETINKIQTLQDEMNGINAYLTDVQTQKENLIKQLSARKAAEKDEQINIEQAEESNIEKKVDEIQQEEIASKDNDNLNK